MCLTKSREERKGGVLDLRAVFARDKDLLCTVETTESWTDAAFGSHIVRIRLRGGKTKV